MDLQTLSNLFATTINPDINLRRAAELQIRKIGNEEGMITALLQIIAADNIDLTTRQACSVWLKNRVETMYSLDSANNRHTDKTLIANSDREALKARIIPLLAVSPSRPITLQLASILKVIISNDFEGKWPGFLAEVKHLLNSTNIQEVHAGCVASLEAVRAFRFRSTATPMPEIVEALFPTLVNIATQMLQSPPTSATEIPTMLHLILKLYKTSIVVGLSTHQQSKESLVPWGQLLFTIVNLQIPPDAVPADEEERERSEWWKVKKWTYGILGRLFRRYGNKSQLPSSHQEQYGAFAQHFVTNFAPEILNMYLNQVQLFVSHQAWLSKKCQYHIFQFLTDCVKPKSTWILLKPSFENLVSSFIYPQLCFNDTKKSLWEGDPVEYVRISLDEYETFTAPVSAATAFLFSLATNRTKTTFMPILGFINTVLRSNSPPPQKFGALNITAALVPWMMRHPDVKGNVEAFVLQFVTPEFASPEAYLRAIACEVVGSVTKAGMVWSNEENLKVNFQGVAAAMDDPELPVRVNAALALTELIAAHESVKTAVRPQVAKVIQDLLKLSNETDLDILSQNLGFMVDAFQMELLPVAPQLASRLCESYVRLAKESMAQEEASELVADGMMSRADEDKIFAAMAVTKTIVTIITSVEEAPEILLQVHDAVLPMLLFTLENKLIDLFDNVYEVVDILTYRVRPIRPTMWPVFEHTYNLFMTDAVDFLEEMLPALDNFSSHGSEVIKSRADYKQMLVDIYSHSMKSEHLGENDRVCGSKLAESILLNLRGSVDEHLQTIISLSLVQLEIKRQTPDLRLANLEVLVNAVLYNPSAALHIMETIRPGMSRTFFNLWFAAIDNETSLPRVHDKKLSILALSALLEMTPNAVPENLKDGWHGIVGGILKIFKDLPQAIEARKALEEELDSDSDEVVEEKILNFNEEEDDVWDQDSAYLEMLVEEGARLRERQEKVANNDYESDSSEEEIEEELGYISAIDNVNPYVSFRHALTTFQLQNGPGYQAATTGLTVEQQTLLMEIMRTAELQSGTPGQS